MIIYESLGNQLFYKRNEEGPFSLDAHLLSCWPFGYIGNAFFHLVTNSSRSAFTLLERPVELSEWEMVLAISDASS